MWLLPDQLLYITVWKTQLSSQPPLIVRLLNYLVKQFLQNGSLLKIFFFCNFLLGYTKVEIDWLILKRKFCKNRKTQTEIAPVNMLKFLNVSSYLLDMITFYIFQLYSRVEALDKLILLKMYNKYNSQQYVQTFFFTNAYMRKQYLYVLATVCIIYSKNM